MDVFIYLLAGVALDGTTVTFENDSLVLELPAYRRRMVLSYKLMKFLWRSRVKLVVLF